MDERQAAFKVGQVFKTRGKFPRLCTVVDVWKTYNADGGLVKLRYVAEHIFRGQIVTAHDVVETTIAMGQINK